jgi:hypothetical protein
MNRFNYHKFGLISWDAGVYAHFYNVFFGAPRVVPDRKLLTRLDIFRRDGVCLNASRGLNTRIEQELAVEALGA